MEYIEKEDGINEAENFLNDYRDTIDPFLMCSEMYNHLSSEKPMYEAIECFWKIIISGNETGLVEMLRQREMDETEVAEYWLKFYVTGLKVLNHFDYSISLSQSDQLLLPYLHHFLKTYLPDSTQAMRLFVREGSEDAVYDLEESLAKLSASGCVYASVLHLSGYLYGGFCFTKNHLRFLIGAQGGMKLLDEMLDDLFINRSLRLFEPLRAGEESKERWLLKAMNHDTTCIRRKNDMIRTFGMDEKQVLKLLMEEPLLFSELISDKAVQGLVCREEIDGLESSLRRRISNAYALYLVQKTMEEEEFDDEYEELPFR